MGQLLSIPLFLAGVGFIAYALKHPLLQGTIMAERPAAGSRDPPAHRRGRADAGRPNTWRCASPIREHGYYTTRDPLGARGDFITAPEVSQMFGELIGLWMAAVWKQMGAPENMRIIELGPGRGTMMKDALRAAKVMPAFRDAVVLHLVEISPALQEQQERTLEHLHDADVLAPLAQRRAEGPAIIVANEFFDALPVNQAVKTKYGWHERQIEIDADGNLAFTRRARSAAAIRPPAAGRRRAMRRTTRSSNGAPTQWRWNWAGASRATAAPRW